MVRDLRPPFFGDAHFYFCGGPLCQALGHPASGPPACAQDGPLRGHLVLGARCKDQSAGRWGGDGPAGCEAVAGGILGAGPSGDCVGVRWPGVTMPCPSSASVRCSIARAAQPRLRQREERPDGLSKCNTKSLTTLKVRWLSQLRDFARRRAFDVHPPDARASADPPSALSSTCPAIGRARSFRARYVTAACASRA